MVIVLVMDNKYWTANSGDSRAVIMREKNGNWRPKPITIDHKPDLPKEKQRIIKAGGRVR